jgi:hypothetical protein
LKEIGVEVDEAGSSIGVGWSPPQNSCRIILGFRSSRDGGHVWVSFGALGPLKVVVHAKTKVFPHVDFTRVSERRLRNPRHVRAANKELAIEEDSARQMREFVQI